MTCLSYANARQRAGWRLAAAVVVLASALAPARVNAADMPDDTILRGSYIDLGPPGFVRWDGIVFGAQVGYSNLNADFSDSTTAVSLPESTTNSAAVGGFLGYNVQWDNLVVGVDGAYNRPSSLETSSTSGTATSSLKLVDYATFRARAGYAFGQFLPYAFLGGAAGRMNYSTTVAGTVTQSRDGGYAAGGVAGVGLDVSILPNVFVRGEYEYVVFSPVGSIRSSLNTARVGLGLRF